MHETGEIEFCHPARYVLQRPETPPTSPAPLLLALHGQGMTSEQFLRILRHLGDAPPYVLAPQGMYPYEKRRPEGMDIGHGWYVYRGDQSEFHEQLSRTEDHLLGLLDRMTGEHPIDRDRVVLLGYSQGGYVAGFMGLRHRHRFRGLVLASTRFKHEFLQAELELGNELPPTLVVHSGEDPSLPWERVKGSIDALRQAGAEVEIHLHDEGHRLPAAAVEAIAAWLEAKGLSC